MDESDLKTISVFIQIEFELNSHNFQKFYRQESVL